MDKFRLEVATPERELVNEEVTEAQIRAKNGYLGILAGHAPLLAELGEGDLTYRCDSSRPRVLTISGGFLEVANDRVRVLADKATRKGE